MTTQPDPAVIQQCVAVDFVTLKALLDHYQATAVAVSQVTQAFAAALTVHGQELAAALQAQGEALNALGILAQALAAQTTSEIMPPGGFEQ